MPAIKNGTGGIGGVLIDSSGRVASWFSHQLTEKICLALGVGDKATIIYELELVAAIFGLTIWSEAIRDHCTVLFVDNEGVRFTIIKASAKGSIVLKLVKYYISLFFFFPSFSQSNARDPTRSVQIARAWKHLESQPEAAKKLKQAN